MDWILPQGIEDILPDAAARLERARRRLLDLFARWGYELVLPPLVEFSDSLLTGAGTDLALQTFQVTDPVSGRQLGLRADITPQIARIDASRPKSNERLARYCYVDNVVTARSQAIGASRNPLQIGAELFGHAGIESDIEVVRLMAATLGDLGIVIGTMDLGHVGIFHALCADADLPRQVQMDLFELLQRKAKQEIEDLLTGHPVAARCRNRFLVLPDLHGDLNVLFEARRVLGDAGSGVTAAIDELHSIAKGLSHWLPDLPMYFDLCELRGYHYHTGLVFAAFVEGEGQAICGGGRYDGAGDVFGRGRPATGFSADLKKLVAHADAATLDAHREFVLVPASGNLELERAVSGLWAKGFGTIIDLPGSPRDNRCKRELVLRDGSWVLESA